MKPTDAIEKLALAQEQPAVRASSRPYTEQLKSLTVDEQSFIFERMDSLKRQTTNTNWLRVEIDKITGMAYFAIVIFLFIIAGLTMTNFLDNFVQTFLDADLAKLILMIFSSAAFVSIVYMIFRRWQSLKENAIIVFDFLLELDAIKVNRANFERPLQQIEQYLNNKEWTLARYWTSRIYADYYGEVQAQYEIKALKSGQP